MENEDLPDLGLTRRDLLKGLGGSLLSILGFSVNSEASESYLDLAYPFSSTGRLYKNRKKREEMNRLIWMYESLDEKIKALSNPKSSRNKSFRKSFNRKLSQFYFEKPFVHLMETYSQEVTSERIQNWFERGKEKGINSLRFNSTFNARFNGENFLNSLESIEDSNLSPLDLETVYFYANNNLGFEIIENLETDTVEDKRDSLKQLKDSIYSYEKIIDLDPEIMGYSSFSALATTYSFIESLTDESQFEDSINQLYKEIFIEESSLDKAEDLYQESLERGDDFLMNNLLYTFFQRNYNQGDKQETYSQRLDNLLEKSDNQEVIERYPLWNQVAEYFAKFMKVSGSDRLGADEFIEFPED